MNSYTCNSLLDKHICKQLQFHFSFLFFLTQAVQFLLGSREQLNSQNFDSKVEETNLQQVDPVQVSCSFSMTDYTSKIPKLQK